MRIKIYAMIGLIILLMNIYVVVLASQAYYNKIRPIVGGIRIEIRKYYIDSERISLFPDAICSSGYMARKWIRGRWVTGYVTNAHCILDTLGGPGWKWWVYQNRAYYGNPYLNFAGSPAYFNTQFDVAFIPYSRVTDAVMGRDAYGKDKPLDITSVIPWDYILFAVQYNIEIEVYKSGMGTGSTKGKIIRVHRGLLGVPYVISADYESDHGDSGGPVYIKRSYWVNGYFGIKGYYETYVELIGIHFATDFNENLSFFIPAERISVYLGIIPVTN